MSLEDRIAALTSVTEALAATMAKNNELLSSGLKMGAEARASAAPSSAASTKAAEPTEMKGKGRPPGSKNKPKAPTADEVRTRFGNYLNEGPGDRAERVENLQAINAHFGISGRLSEGDPSIFPEALGYLDQLEKGETPDFMNEEAAAEEGGESLV